MPTDDDSPKMFDPATDPFVEGAHLDRRGLPDPEADWSDPDLGRLALPGLELRQFIREQLRALNPQPSTSRPPRLPKPSVRVRTRAQAIRGEG